MFAAGNSSLVDRVGSTGFVQLEVESFHSLSPKDQTLAYWLTQASIAIDPINLRPEFDLGSAPEAVLEGVLRHPRV